MDREQPSAPLPRVRAIARHEPSTRPPLRVAAGDRVEVGRRDDEWPAFAFVSNGAGSGWVPVRYLSASEGTAEVRRPYDTTELRVEAGEVLEVLAEDVESGWDWCRAPDGREGWVPIRVLEGADAT